MKDDRYSPDWPELARQKKQSVNWCCERCGVQCLKPGEGKGLSNSERHRLRMSVHHCDYNPGNNAPENLLALCARSCANKVWGKGQNRPKSRAERLNEHVEQQYCEYGYEPKSS